MFCCCCSFNLEDEAIQMKESSSCHKIRRSQEVLCMYQTLKIRPVLGYPIQNLFSCWFRRAIFKSPMTNVWRLLNPTIFLLSFFPLFDLKQTQTSPKVVGKRSMMFQNKNKCINRHYSAVYREKIYQNKLQIAHKLFKLHQIFS